MEVDTPTGPDTWRLRSPQHFLGRLHRDDIELAWGLSGRLPRHLYLFHYLVMPASSLGKQTAVQTQLPVTQEVTLKEGNS